MELSAVEAGGAAERARTGAGGVGGRVRAARAGVPGDCVVPGTYGVCAFAKGPVPIGHGQTISQPYIVALMTALLRPRRDAVILEIGTGSGYQAAVLARLVRHVYTIEIVPALAEAAAKRLSELGYANVTVRHGDGWHGWPEHAPFDGIVVTAASPAVPPALVAQLKPGARLVIPVGKPGCIQDLRVVEKAADGACRSRSVLPVAFVPLTRQREDGRASTPD